MTLSEQIDLASILDILNQVKDSTYKELPDEDLPKAVGMVIGANFFNHTRLKFCIEKLENLNN